MSTPDGLPPLREVIAGLGLRAKKSLGQNFLLDLNLTRRIARAAAPLDGHTVVEVGPGPGGLTRGLLIEGASKVIAVERDSRMLPALETIARAYPGRLSVLSGDALAIDWASLAGGPFKVVANLPYNVATALLVAWLTSEPWPPWWSSLTLMFQREVAERITAPPGSKDYGRLSVLAQWRAAASRLFDVDARAFTPQPRITSSLVRIVPGEPPIPCELSALEQVTAAAFGQRRKMLRSSLKGLMVDPEAVFERVGIDPTRRAESLSVLEFCRLAQKVPSLRFGS